MKLFPGRYRLVKNPPPLPFSLAWAGGTVWLIAAATALFRDLSWGPWTFRAWVIFFVLLEGFALAKRIPGGTYSEWQWWYVDSVWARAVWAFPIIVMSTVYVHPLLGIVFAVWYFPHIVMSGRSD